GPNGIRVSVKLNAADTGGAKRRGDENYGVRAPLDDLDLLFVEFLGDVLNTVAAHADTRADRVNPFLQSGNGELRTITRFTGDVLDLDLSVVNFGDFVFEQAAEHVAVAAADDDLRTAARLL